MDDHLSSLYFEDNRNHQNDDDDGDSLKKPCKDKCSKTAKESPGKGAPAMDPPYILGTLIVRVVSARDLPPGHCGGGVGGLGEFLFGGGGRRGTANPYASVRFGSSVQRTSELYDTLDPVWPRGETMFMDVSLPLSHVTHPHPTSISSPTSSYSSPSVTDSADTAYDPGNGNSNNIRGATTTMNHYHYGDSGNRDDKGKRGNINRDNITGLPSPRHYDKNHTDSTEQLYIPKPILTVAVFSASDAGKESSLKGGGDPRYPKEKTRGDSDDCVLGMASVDLTSLITGKRSIVDAWLPLMGCSVGHDDNSDNTRNSINYSASVRVICEYETADVAPSKDDLVRFTRFCHPTDIYPLIPGKIYPVQQVVDKDRLLLSYTSPEGWVCSFLVHRFMVLCTERHHGAVSMCREEWQSITERLSHSPLVETVASAVQRLPEDGLFAVGAHVIQGSAGLLGRWLEGGIDTAVKDVAFSVNWDGRFNPSNPLERRGNNTQSSPSSSSSSSDAALENASDYNEISANETDSEETTQIDSNPLIIPTESSSSSDTSKYILPNMPSCPITGEPMFEPVVAADGHTYERAAIARWLQTSDKSPLTGSILPHKELVPNYGLLSSLQEQAEACRKPKKPPLTPVTANVPVAVVPDPESEEDEIDVS